MPLDDERGAEPEADVGPEAGPEPEATSEPATATAAEPDVALPLPGAGTPDGDKLRDAHRAFEVGDYAQVRRTTRSLADASDPDVTKAASELRARTEVDPIQIGVLLGCLVLLVFLTYVYVLP